MSETNAFAKRRILAKHRIWILNLAIERMIDQDLRDKEVAAQAAMVAAICSDIKAIPEVEMKALERFGFARSVKQITLYASRPIKTGGKTFTLPNGEVVERDELKAIKIARSITGLSTWAAAAELMRLTFSDLTYRLGEQRSVVIEPIMIPSSKRDGRQEREDLVLDSNCDGSYIGIWATDATRELVDQFFLAAGKRFDIEFRLIRAMFAMLKTSQTFGEVLTFFPEAAELTNDLFGEKPIPTNRALQILSDEDRALVCNSLSRRGVRSDACDCAVSPAYEEAAA